jgi:hypothetical protein
MCKTPCLLHKTLLSEILTLSILPGRRVDGWAMMTTFRQQQPGLIVHATRFLCAFIVEAQGISHRNIFVCQCLFFHICKTMLLVCKDMKFLPNLQGIEEKLGRKFTLRLNFAIFFI